MADDNQKISSNFNYWIVLLAAIFGGGGASLGVLKTTDVRPDPFTGKQGKALERRIERLETYKESHTNFAYERTIEWNREIQRLRNCCEKKHGEDK